ncbi:MAG TPA: YpdA family putative bacillithiol disulfide reductase [Gemmatimonadales bacterium]|nr:YpdA family putative bacillithiol disulfide reductase [Gemmatimonadales bacterium]
MISLLIIGAGPAGLATGLAARHAGLDCVLLDRSTVVSAIEKYPLGMTFFSTPEKLEIGGVPFVTATDKPSRREGLIYYRRVAEMFKLDVRVREEVTGLRQEADGTFTVTVKRPHDTVTYRARTVVVATGYYDQPNRLGVPGEELPHVSHYFTEGHRHWRQKVVIVGGGNSGVDAALESWRAGAEVTMVLRGAELHSSVKAWVLPDIHNRIKEGSIRVRWQARVRAISPTHVDVEHADGHVERIPADQVLLLTGYRPDMRLLRAVGVPIHEETGVPRHDEATMATPVPGLYIAGVLAGGDDDNRLFIENTRHHGELIVKAIMARPPAAA